MPNSHTVLISGVGQLGSRYLQGLASCKIPMRILVRDLSEESLLRAKQRWMEVKDGDSPQDISFATGLEGLPREVDVCIVATTADVRPAAVRGIARKSRVRYWILEKLLAQNLDGLDEFHSVVDGAEGTWVNMVRRVIPWHQEIRQAIGVRKQLHVELHGGLWGLACNGIHLIDHVTWLSGERLHSIDASRLDPVWVDTKRAGFQEVTGTLQATYSGGTTLLLSATRDKLPADYSVRYSVMDVQNGTRWTISERDGVANCSDGRRVEGRMKLQSELTGRLVDGILAAGECDLTTFEESAEMHRMFLKALLKHRRVNKEPRAKILPIT